MVLMAQPTVDLVSILRSAVEDRLDGNVGIAVSGGLDSSVVASLAPQELPTFTGYYDEPGFDEREYARLVAHPEHHEIKITPQDFVENFDDMKKALRPPIMGMGSFGQWMVAKYIRQNTDVRVVLSGEGSDELFGGYARQMIVAGEAPPEGYEHYILPDGYPRNLADALAYDYAVLPDLLAVDDQMTGAWGLEARAPFTDERIVEYGLSLPIFDRVGKRHLRELVRAVVPGQIVDRKDKIGFAIPVIRWANEHAGVRALSLDRVGYVPDITRPWDRRWWHDMVASK